MRGIGSSNCSKSNNSSSSSSNGGRPELAQSYTNLGLTQDSGMEGTMKNLTFLTRYGGCAIAKKACVRGIPTASERGAESEVAHKWAKWLPHPCRIGDPHRFRAGGKIRKKGFFLLIFLLSKKKFFFSTQFFTE